jgi:hypothetical protein
VEAPQSSAFLLAGLLASATSMLAACGPPAPRDGVDAAETETDTGEPDGTDTGSSVEPDIPSDRPHDPDCLPYSEITSFEELCLGEPIVLDPSPMNFLDRDDPDHLYVAGPDDHRVYGPEALAGEAEPQFLPLAGTTVASVRTFLPEGGGRAIVTTQPASFVLLTRERDTLDVQSVIPLDAEPTDVSSHRTESSWGVAFADVTGRVHFFEFDDLGGVVELGSREFPEPLDRLSRNSSFGAHDRLYGLSRASSTAWRLLPPVSGDGEIEAWALPLPATDWVIHTFADTYVERILMFSSEPGATMFNYFGAATSEWSFPLAHEIRSISQGSAGYIFGELYALSTDARIAALGLNVGHATLFFPPRTWLDLPEGTVDFVALGDGRFLCASTIHGLILVEPANP